MQGKQPPGTWTPPDSPAPPPPRPAAAPQPPPGPLTCAGSRSSPSSACHSSTTPGMGSTAAGRKRKHTCAGRARPGGTGKGGEGERGPAPLCPRATTAAAAPETRSQRRLPPRPPPAALTSPLRLAGAKAGQEDVEDAQQEVHGRSRAAVATLLRAAQPRHAEPLRAVLRLGGGSAGRGGAREAPPCAAAPCPGPAWGSRGTRRLSAGPGRRRARPPRLLGEALKRALGLRY